MEGFQTHSQRLTRNSRHKNKTLLDLQIQGEAKIRKDQKQQETIVLDQSINAQHIFQIHKNKFKGFTLFQNISINKSLINEVQHDVMLYDQVRKCTPDVRVLRKKRNGKVTFQTIPQLIFPKQQMSNTIHQNFIIQRLQPKAQGSIKLSNFHNDYKNDVFFSERLVKKNEFVNNNFQ